MRRVLAVLAAAAVVATLTACTKTIRTDMVDSTVFTQPADAAPVVQAHNERAERLRDLTARGILSLRFPDPEKEGDTRYEQGDLNLQRRAPSDTALVLTTLGETLIWLGSNDDAFWLFDDLQTDTAFIGRLDEMTLEKLNVLALPLSPLDLPLLMGVEPILGEAAALVDPGTGDVLVESRMAGFTVLTRFPDGGDVANAIEFRDASGTPRITALATDPIEVTAPADPFADGPSLVRSTGDSIPANLRIVLHDTDTIVTFVFSTITTARPRDAAFDFETLLQRFRPDEVIDLDEPGAVERARARGAAPDS